MRWAHVAVLAALGLLGIAGLAGAASRASPIEGIWDTGSGHLQRVVAVGGGFEVRAASSWTLDFDGTGQRTCTIKTGEVLDRLTPTGPDTYASRYTYLDFTGCVRSVRGPVTVKIIPADGGTALKLSCANEDRICAVWHRVGNVPTPKPTPVPKAWTKLTLDYQMPDRYGLDGNKDHVTDALTTRAQIDPPGWTAFVTIWRPGRAHCDSKASYAWKIGGDPNRFEPLGKCVFAFRHFPHLGEYRVSVTTTNGDKKGFGEILITIKDLLVVGIGDSVGSGEGNPDIPAAVGLHRAQWQSLRCNRSHYSFEAQTAGALEDVSDQTSVTFLHLACSGATIKQGLIGGYRGINDPGGPPISPQVTALAKLKGQRQVDAVLVSIGANDIGFGPVVQFCLAQTFCPNKKFPNAASAKTLEAVLQERIAALPGQYAAFAAGLKAVGVLPDAVYITQYFDPTRDYSGEFCDPLIQVPVKVQIVAQGEAKWLYENLVIPLNAAVAAAAQANGWKLVSGVQQIFRRHGYCSDDSWIVRVKESLLSQHDSSGTLHPNARGHEIISHLVGAALKRNKITARPA